MMLATALVVFGPCDGFRAYTASDLSEIQDDTLALSSSQFLLNPDGVLIRIQRNQSADRATRIGIYKQVYEPNLDRLGHSFGVSLTIRGGCPEAASVTEVLVGLLEIVQEGCVQQGRFCDPHRFRDFLLKHKQTFANALASLREIPSAIASSSLSSRNTDAYCIEVGDDLLDSQVLALVDWFCSKPSALLCNELFVSQRAAGVPGSLLQSLPDKSVIDEQAIKLFFDFSLSSSAQVSSQKKELDIKERELAQVVLDKKRLAEAVEKLQLEVNRLNAENIFLRNQPKHTLVDADFEKIRVILKQCIPTAAPMAKPPVSVPPEDEVSSGNYEQGMHWAKLGLIVFGGGFILVAAVMAFTHLISS